MDAVEIDDDGRLRMGERHVPEVGPDDVLIEIAAAGVSHADVLQRRGLYPPPRGASDILGLECAGTVRAVGASVLRWHAGQDVCALLAGGGYAEYVAVPQTQVLPIPPGWNFVEAATLPENTFTVYDNLITRAHFSRGESLLVHGGTSGIGSTAIMLACALGAGPIVATVGTQAKMDAVRDIGATHAICYQTEDFVEASTRLVPKGLDVVVDIVGGSYIERDLRVLASDGRIVSLAVPAGAEVQVDLRTMMAKRATLLASSLRARTPEQKGQIRDAILRDVWPLLPARDVFRPLVDQTVPFCQAQRAHDRLQASEHVGKIVLVPG